MIHETHSLDHCHRKQPRAYGGRSADAAVSRQDEMADHGPSQGQPTSLVGHGDALAVGQRCQAISDGETIQLSQVTRDFIHWINPTTGSTGRMLRAHFLNFFTPIS